jgi:hypothetical protein
MISKDGSGGLRNTRRIRMSRKTAPASSTLLLRASNNGEILIFYFMIFWEFGVALKFYWNPFLEISNHQILQKGPRTDFKAVLFQLQLLCSLPSLNSLFSFRIFVKTSHFFSFRNNHCRYISWKRFGLVWGNVEYDQGVHDIISVRLFCTYLMNNVLRNI